MCRDPVVGPFAKLLLVRSSYPLLRHYRKACSAQTEAVALARWSDPCEY